MIDKPTRFLEYTKKAGIVDLPYSLPYNKRRQKFPLTKYAGY